MCLKTPKHSEGEQERILRIIVDYLSNNFSSFYRNACHRYNSALIFHFWNSKAMYLRVGIAIIFFFLKECEL